jgi:3-oxoacyl-[acyl-carrier-protein] synthase-3
MYINATGYYIPSTRVPNDYFTKVAGLTPQWIEKRSGIKTRARAGADENCETMAIAAVDDALKNLTAYDIKDIDLIVAASYTPRDLLATLAHVVQRHYDIGHDGLRAVQISSACTSFVNTLEIIEAYFALGKAHRALLVCSEHNTAYSDDSDPNSGFLWGDAAVAWFVSSEPAGTTEPKIRRIHTAALGNVGRGPEGLILRPRGGGIQLVDGRDVFANATREMIVALEHVLAPDGLHPQDLDYIIPHQANQRVVLNVARRLDMSADRFLGNISTIGNTGSASAALVFAQNRDRFVSPMHIGLATFGGGYSSGAVLIDI